MCVFSPPRSLSFFISPRLHRSERPHIRRAFVECLPRTGKLLRRLTGFPCKPEKKCLTGVGGMGWEVSNLFGWNSAPLQLECRMLSDNRLPTSRPSNKSRCHHPTTVTHISVCRQQGGSSCLGVRALTYIKSPCCMEFVQCSVFSGEVSNAFPTLC